MPARKKRRTSAPSGQFDLVVIGCGGGHDETNLSGYLCKPRDQSWADGILGLEAGSGYGALKRLLDTTHPLLFSSLFPPNAKTSAIDRAHTVYTHLRAFLLTHAHLDHVASLIISAGSLPGPTKYVLGAKGVLDDLDRYIFAPGRCWPNIVGWDGNTSGGRFKALPVSSRGLLDEKLAGQSGNKTRDRDDEYTELHVGMDSVRARLVPLTHGGCCADQRDKPEIYRSTAFFIRHVPTRHEYLFFGDVEADPDILPTVSLLAPTSALNGLSDTNGHSSPVHSPVSAANGLSLPISCSRPLLLPVWQHTAHLFSSSRLHTLLLECSWPAGRPSAQLFGHLGVEQVRKEMRVLAEEVVKARQRQKAGEEKLGTPLVQPLPSAKPILARPVRRVRTQSPPRATRSLKRKAAHLSLDTSPGEDIGHPDPLAGALVGLRVIIIHCKEPAPGFDLAGTANIADYIVRQLTEGVKGSGPNEPGLGPDELGVEYVAAHQGDEFGQDADSHRVPVL